MLSFYLCHGTGIIRDLSRDDINVWITENFLNNSKELDKKFFRKHLEILLDHLVNNVPVETIFKL